MLVLAQLLLTGLYLPAGVQRRRSHQIHPRRSFRCRSRPPCESIGAEGTLALFVVIQLSVLGLYLPPVFIPLPTPNDHFSCRSRPPCDRVGQRARWKSAGGIQLSVLGLYLPPVF